MFSAKRREGEVDGESTEMTSGMQSSRVYIQLAMTPRGRRGTTSELFLLSCLLE